MNFIDFLNLSEHDDGGLSPIQQVFDSTDNYYDNESELDDILYKKSQKY